MWFTKQQSGFRAWFIIKGSNGLLAPGILPDHFVATLRSPTDLTGSTFPVTQSAKPGLYRFDVPAGFMLSGGYGEYGAVVEVSSITPHVSDAMSSVMRVTREDFDSLSSSVASSVWDEPNNLHAVTGSTGDSLMSASATAAISASISVDATAIAAAVWDEQLASHLTSGSAGWTIDRIDTSITNVSSTLGYMSGSLRSLYDMNFGRWKIVTNQMVFYAPDNVTEVARFDLFDDVGNPSMDAVFERKKV